MDPSIAGNGTSGSLSASSSVVGSSGMSANGNMAVNATTPSQTPNQQNQAAAAAAAAAAAMHSSTARLHQLVHDLTNSARREAALAGRSPCSFWT